MIDLVTFTTLYPNREQPHKGAFVEQRLRHLLATGKVRSKVVAPVPWFPFKGRRFGNYASFARVPEKESRHGVEIVHPRYPLPPKIGMTIAPWLMAAAARPVLRRMLRSGRDFVAIDAHYFYPDGVAAALVGRWIRRPVVITARGTDINLIPRYLLPRKQILWAANRAAAIVTVCGALKDALVDLGAPEARITILRNGVDLDLFHPVSREDARRRLGIRGPTLLSVGYLIQRKGHHIAIEALRTLPDVQLVIVGDGELGTFLRELARENGVAERVRFCEPVPQEELKYYYSAADALVLASDREGMANVLLESLACGTPVIANPAWGTPEVVSDPVAGVLMARRDAASLAEGYRRLIDRYPSQESVRRFAQRFSWDPTTRGQLEIFGRLSGD
jgi:glycosyltransferase involved in cell wall biosynthesis